MGNVTHKKISELSQKEHFKLNQLANCEISDGDFISYIVVADEIVAMVVSEMAERQLYLSNLFVKSNYRMQGLAQCLLNHCKTFARENGCLLVYLVVANSNKAAKKLYFKNGFVINPYATYFLGRSLPKHGNWELIKSAKTSYGVSNQYKSKYGIVNLYNTDELCYVIYHETKVNESNISDFLAECQFLTDLPLRVSASILPEIGASYFESLGWEIDSFVMKSDI